MALFHGSNYERWPILFSWNFQLVINLKILIRKKGQIGVVHQSSGPASWWFQIDWGQFCADSWDKWVGQDSAPRVYFLDPARIRPSACTRPVPIGRFGTVYASPDFLQFSSGPNRFSLTSLPLRVLPSYSAFNVLDNFL